MRFMQIRIHVQAAMIGLCVLQCAVAEDAPSNDKRFVAFDIESHANKKLSDDFHTLPGNNLKLLPRGRQRMADVDFLIGEKFVQLAGKKAPDYPEKIEGIVINRELARLHILHGCGWVVQNGTVIGDYVIHYDDKSTIRLPIEYGHDVKDWWLYEFEKEEPTRAVLAWKGLNHASKNFQGRRISIGLFRMTWENPSPEKKVASVDFLSRNETACSPFLVAMTGESLNSIDETFEPVAPKARKVAVRDSAVPQVSRSAEESAAIEELQELKALLEFNDDGRVRSVAISGPGLRLDVARGSNQTVALLSHLPTIEILDLSSSSVTDEGMESLEKLPNLRVLSLNLTSITNSGLERLKHLKQLERLRLHETPITDEGMAFVAGFTTLKVLDLSKTQIGDAGVAKLKTLEALSELDLRHTRVTEAGVAVLKDTLPNVKILR